MKYLKIYSLALLALFAISCEDKLEIEPRQSISGDFAVTSEDNLENILIGTYDEAGQDESYGGQLQMIADLLGAGDIIDWGGTFLDPRQIKNKQILTDNGFVAGYWNNAYETINQANLIINNIDIVTSDPAKKDRIEGEAKFLRALTYFDLIRHFGSGATGVPMRTEGILDYSGDLGIGRGTTAEANALILADLQDAVSKLPETNSFFADKYSAQALLARYYLQQGDFAGARDAAHDVIMNSGHALMGSFPAAFNHDSDEAEDVFAFQVTSQTGDNDLINHYASEGNGGRGGDISINTTYQALFDDLNDVRASFNYISPQTGEPLTSKYTNQFGNIILIRLAEMHLIRAEANFELGTSVGMDPLTELNAVRARSTSVALVGPVTKDMILRERVLELAFEGLSIHDVVRTQGSVDGFAWNAQELTLPIPQSEIDTNPMAEQNPGYN
ncbi:MAG: RagB/SusD family nutrient uptake outer membrane protein [Saprospiraceae bacterium]|nr:RagB/SusD family nutrient uptake outer membrane protein [Saprospiraceae bacterium]